MEKRHAFRLKVRWMIKKYHMILHGPMGPREGTLTLDESCGEVAGSLCILSHELPVHGSRGTDGRLHLMHQIITAVSEYPCCSVLRDVGDTLSGELQMDQSGAPWRWGKCPFKTILRWSGERLEEREAARN